MKLALDLAIICIVILKYENLKSNTAILSKFFFIYATLVFIFAFTGYNIAGFALAIKSSAVFAYIVCEMNAHGF